MAKDVSNLPAVERFRPRRTKAWPVRRLSKHAAFVRPNKSELYWSLLATGIGVFNTGSFPRDSYTDLVVSGALLVGLFCAVNAALDQQRMSRFERVLVTLLLSALLCLVPLWPLGVATRPDYGADR